MISIFASKVVEKGGHISEKSFEGHREFFLGKSVKKIQKEMSDESKYKSDGKETAKIYFARRRKK